MSVVSKRLLYILGIIILFVVIFFISKVENDDNSVKKEAIKPLDYIVNLENKKVETFLKSSVDLQKVEDNEREFNDVIERNQVYTNKDQMVKVILTTRYFSETDKIVMIRLINKTNSSNEVQFVQRRQNIKNSDLSRFDRFPLKITEDASFGEDMSTYPIGLETIVDNTDDKTYRMLGKTFTSREMVENYKNGDSSITRELISEHESYQNNLNNESFESVYRLQSSGEDIVETWFIESNTPLFQDSISMDNWMKETSENSRLRNMWYTVDGPYNKMASAIEPIPESGQGFGRLLLMIKDDRALAKYKETKEHYFYILLKNSYVDLEKYKEDKIYWATEVTSTWLKRLYNIHAPFIDTRFNELIALFILESGDVLDYKNNKDGLRNYANLLVEQVKIDNIIYSKSGNGYYIQDYFAENGKIKTHASLNHLLGGLNILLRAYIELGNEEYLEIAQKILEGIVEDRNLWVREETGDLWYQVNIDRTFTGDDYQHLTMTDLVYTYQLLTKIDVKQEYIKSIEFLIQQKFNYLDKNNLGSSTNLRKKLHEIGRTDYIPSGPKLVDGK